MPTKSRFPSREKALDVRLSVASITELVNEVYPLQELASGRVKTVLSS
jgi:hypothetical protein